jgi:nucleoside-diphosphate-sugar epimerase
MVYGPGDPDRRLGSYVQRMLDGRSAILLHDAAARWRNSRAFVTNAANAIASVVRSGARGRVYNVADPLDMEEADLILAIGQVLRWTGAVHVVPPDWSWQARPAIDEFPIQTRFAQHLRIDSSRLRQELGYEESVSFEAGLECTVRELASSPVEIDYAEEDRLLAAQARGVSPVSGRTDEPAGG